ncbi:hypothetical protein MP638_003370, partial [Amoeboaphelidium occidentale]
NEAEYLCLKDMDNRPLKCKQENDHHAELRVYYLDKFDRGFCGKVLIEIHRTDNKTQQNHGRKCFLGVNRAGNLEVYNHIQTECIWVQTCITGVISFYVSPYEFLCTKFLLDDYNLPGSPISLPDQYQAEYESYFSERNFTRSGNRVEIGFDIEQGSIFAVALGDGSPDNALLNNANWLGTKSNGSDVSLLEWLNVPEDRTFIMSGAEASLYGALRTVQVETKWGERVLPIVCVTASAYTPDLTILLMSTDGIVQNITKDLECLQLEYCSLPEYDLDFASEQRPVKDLLSSSGYNDLKLHTHEDSKSDVAVNAAKITKCMACRYHQFLTKHLIPQYKPKTIVLSGSLIDILWPYFEKTITKELSAQSNEGLIIINPFQSSSSSVAAAERETATKSDAIYTEPVLETSNSMTTSLGAAIAALRGVSIK